MLLSWNVDATTLTGDYVELENGERPVSTSVSEIGHLVMLVEPQEILSTRIWGKNQSYVNFEDSCSPSGVVGDASPFGAGFVRAAANGENTPDWGCSIAPPDAGPATRIDLARIYQIGGESNLGGFDAGGPIVALKTAPHPDGA